MKIHFTPWFNVPLHRRLELFSTVLTMFIALFLGPCCVLMILYLLYEGNIYLRAICILYLAFIYYDRDAGDTGGRGSGVRWIRRLIIWKYTVDYFPLDMVKTVDLPPNKNYLICIFPHGLMGLSTYVNWSTSFSKWSTLFPKIRSKAVSLGINFLCPVVREFHLSCGGSAASARSIKTLLNQSNDPNDKSNRDGYTANGVGLVVGGAKESFYAVHNTYRVILKNRKGFVRVALETGAPIVPAIAFGENSIYQIVQFAPDSWGRTILEMIKKLTTINPVPFNGRGIFQYNFGFLPKRMPITTVIGAPINVDKIPTPTSEDIDKVHSLFCEKLTELFETNKSKHVDDYENVHLEII